MYEGIIFLLCKDVTPREALCAFCGFAKFRIEQRRIEGIGKMPSFYKPGIFKGYA